MLLIWPVLIYDLGSIGLTISTHKSSDIGWTSSLIRESDDDKVTPATIRLPSIVTPVPKTRNAFFIATLPPNVFGNVDCAVVVPTIKMPPWSCNSMAPDIVADRNSMLPAVPE